MDKHTKIVIGVGVGLAALYYYWSVNQPKAAVAAAVAAPATTTTTAPATTAADGTKVFAKAEGFTTQAVAPAAEHVFKGASGEVFAKAEGSFFKGHSTKW